jgi:hypothetical protein
MGSVFTIEATARFPDLCGIIVESGLSDLYPFMVQRMKPADLLGLYDSIVETSGAGFELTQGDSEEEKHDVVRASLRAACDRVLGLDRKWQAYRVLSSCPRSFFTEELHLTTFPGCVGQCAAVALRR